MQIEYGNWFIRILQIQRHYNVEGGNVYVTQETRKSEQEEQKKKQ